MIRRTLAVAFKEFVHLRRDWRSSLTLLGMPIVLLMIYGYALSFDVRDIRLAIVDLDQSRPSRELVEAFLHCGYFNGVHQGDDIRVLDQLFDQELAQAALVIPPNFARKVSRAERANIQFILDGSDSQTANTILGYANQIVAANGAKLVPRTLPRPGIPVIAKPVVWYNPDLDSTIFLVPGLLAFILMITSVIATALAVVREKERGTMESLRSTPLRAIELLLGKTIPYLVLASFAAAGALLLAWGLFDVPIRGSTSALVIVTLLFLAGGLGWGVFLSTVADTQQVAFQTGLLSSMLPSLLLSGFIFPISSMPKALQIITHIVPARYYVAALRAIVLKGAGPEVWLPEAIALAVFAAIVLLVSTARMIRSL